MSVRTNKSLISRSSTSALKIIFQVMVLFHHLYLCSTEFGNRVSAMAGPIAVGGFLVLSGYGVGVNYKKSGDGYCEKLLKKRIPSTYLILLITDLCYLALYFYTGGRFENAFDLITSVLYIPLFDGFVTLSHYVYFLADLIIYYLIFLLFSFIFRKKNNALLLAAACTFALMLVIIIVLTIINSTTGSSRYLRACVCFPIGLFLANFDDIICEFLDDYKWLVSVTFLVLGFAFYITFGLKTVNEYIVPSMCSLFVITAVYGANSKAKLLDYLAKLIIYIYVSHEFFRELFIYRFPEMHQNLRAIIVVAMSLFVAVLITGLINFISKKSKNIEKNAS